MRRTLAALLLAAATLAGCGGISDPYNDQPVTTAARTQSTTTQPQTQTQTPATIDEGIGRSAPTPDDRLDRAAMSRSAAGAIERYGALTGTWTWRDIVAKYRSAARISIEQARERATTSAAQIPAVTSYRTRGVRQTTTIEAIVAQGQGQGEDEDAADGGDPAYLIVQRRRIEMLDAPPSNQWFVSLATLRRVDGRWAVSSWEDLA